jgi:hypothetical protein
MSWRYSLKSNMLKNVNKWIELFFLGLGVFLTSLVILMLESILNRMFAATFWYHFAFVVLTIALFGIGVGGILVYFIPKFLLKFTPIIVAILAIIFSFTLKYYKLTKVLLSHRKQYINKKRNSNE